MGLLFYNGAIQLGVVVADADENWSGRIQMEWLPGLMRNK